MTDDNKTTPTPAPGLDLVALDEVRRIVEAIEHGSAPESDSEAHRWMSLLAREVAAMRWVDESQRRQCDALIAEVRALRAAIAEVRDLIGSTEHESTCAIGPYNAEQNGADCSCTVGAISAALEAL